MKIVIDMNLPAEWVAVLQSEGHEARHWFDVGNPRAADRVIMEWARANGFVVFTHDLDFGMLLAATKAMGPSVIQVRVQDPFPKVIGQTVIDALGRFEKELTAGAIVVIDPPRNRVRLLPIK
jgi:predicted nuclease of predicted toxin-antitoxin system